MDFDGSGRLSLLSGSNCCDSLGFHLFRRLENGAWAPRQRLEFSNAGKIKLPALFAESFVTAADWNGDGVPDLLLSGNKGKGIVVALGPFKDKEPIALSHEIDIDRERNGPAQDFAVADWDRDGKPDLLVRHGHWNQQQGIYWYKNLGGPGMTKLAEGKLLVEIPADVHVQGFCIGDWNGDGWPDLIATREVRLPETDGLGRWQETVWLYRRE